ncbi:hypothetical protein [Novipirellula rosea]|uniref:Uncharacterized protein n=1 Tax=Novipirellula rosea TaxID=1031540 RepID=A0ABP8NB06_9BACT
MAIDEFKMPESVIDAITNTTALTYRASQLRLIDRKDWELSWVSVSSEETEYVEEDPRSYEGFYIIDALPILEPADGWQTQLYWYPYYQRFGQWDGEHRNAYVFQSAHWNDIAKSPEVFLDGLLDPSRDFVTFLRPWLDDDSKFLTREEMYSWVEERISAQPTLPLNHEAIAIQLRIDEILKQIDSLLRTITSVGDVQATKSHLEKLVNALEENRFEFDSIDEDLISDETESVLLDHVDNIQDTIHSLQSQSRRVSSIAKEHPEVQQLLTMIVSF